MNRSRSVTVAFLAFAAACTSVASAAGPDVTLQNITGTTNYGLVGSVRGYAYDSYTCNIGTSNLLWTNSGTPGYAMNLFRIYDGRIQQIGMSFCKMACCAAAVGWTRKCAGGSVLGVGCRDVYGSGWNGGQTRLAARSAINGYTGVVSSYSAASGSAVFKRLQVNQSDLVTSAAGFPVHVSLPTASIPRPMRLMAMQVS